MVKKPTTGDNSQTPADFPTVTPAVDIFSMTDIRVVLIQQQKLTSEVENLTAAVKTTHAVFKELRNWIIGVLVLGMGAIVWANSQFQHHQEQISELNKAIAVIQVQTSATHDDIKGMRDRASQEKDEKPPAK